MKNNIHISKNKLNGVIQLYKKEFSTNEIINVVITIFLQNHSFEQKIMQSLNECSKYYTFSNTLLFNKFVQDFKFLSLKNIENIFESLIDIDRKKAEGAVYTPDYIIDYILNYSLTNYKGISIPIICDPACGSGGFLVRAIKILSDKYNLDLEESIQYIKGIDINEESISCAKIIIEL